MFYIRKFIFGAMAGIAIWTPIFIGREVYICSHMEQEIGPWTDIPCRSITGRGNNFWECKLPDGYIYIVEQ